MASLESGNLEVAAAQEAGGRGDFDAVIAHLSAAMREFTAAGAVREAAMACVGLGDTYANMFGNATVGRAWFARARRLVAEIEPCVEQGWVAIAPMGCDVDDPDELLRSAELALARAREFGDVNLETKALADAGLAHVQAGRVEEGMAMLDEAMALACGPADDTGAAGKSVCSFFTACYFTADFEKARIWTDLFRTRGLIGEQPGVQTFLSSHCDSVQATTLVELGRWSEAERVLLRSIDEVEQRMGIEGWHPSISLADLRIRQGRVTDAEALLVGKDASMHALIPMVRLHLRRGDFELAQRSAQRGMRVMGADRLRAVELLTLLVDAQLGLDDLDAASATCADLTQRAHALGVTTVAARAAMARARVLLAADNASFALTVLEEAADTVAEDRLPWLHATLLLAQASAREAVGDATGAQLDAKAATTTLARLDVVVGDADRGLLARLLSSDTPPPASGDSAAARVLARTSRGWVVTASGATAQVGNTKGIRYLAALLERPGTERHALDLVDAVEGVGATNRRDLGTAGPAADTAARADYRHKIEQLRAEIDDALAAHALDRAEALQGEIDALVAHLSAAFGLGGKNRQAGSAAEKARVNVTRALRTAIGAVSAVAPEAGRSLDRDIRTGTYCAYVPAAGDAGWTVQPGLFSRN